MKIYAIILPLLFFSCLVHGQEWHLQTPMPQGYTLKSVHFPDSLTGYAVGDHGTIMKTTNGGLTWFSLPGFADVFLISVHFTDTVTGYLLENRTIHKTNDGGNSWTAVYSHSSNNVLKTITFVDSGTGFALGNGIILKTINGGTTWTTSLSGSNANSLNSICFPNKNTGYASGGYGKIVKTTDRGNTWNVMSSGNSNTGQYRAITFTNSLTGFVAGTVSKNHGYLILRTINGGVSWDTIMTGINGVLTSVTCTDKNNVVATGYKYANDYARFGMLFRTTNGGLTWDSIYYAACEVLNNIHFSSPLCGYIVGAGGKIISTVNGGATWEEYASGSAQDIYALYFTDRLTGYATGSNSTILKTLDGGSNWTVSFSSAKGELQSIFFTDKDNGYIAGSHGALLKTADAGQTWTGVPGIDTNIWFRSIHFPDHNTGYAGGYKSDRISGNVILKSIDAGVTWDTTASLWLLMPGLMNNVYFIDEFTGFAAGGISQSQQLGGSIIKTLDGGSTWKKVFNDSNYPIHSIVFTAPDTGYAVGGGWNDYWLPWSHGIILKTIDGGETWDALTTKVTIPLFSVFFTDKNTGFAAGGKGTILKTINAGMSWIPLTTCTKYNLNTICFSDAQTGYCAGEYGNIIQTTNAGTGFPEGSIRESRFNIYPNPCTDLVTIELSDNREDAEGAITLFAITGQRLIRKEMKGTIITLDIASLPAGICFVTYVSREFTETVKILKR